MSCEEIRNELALYLYGELDSQEEEILEQHIASCPGCQQELRREQAAHAMLDAALESGEDSVPTQLLTDCRRELRSALQAGTEAREKGWRGWWSGLLHSAWSKPAGAVAFMAIGFFGAKLIIPAEQAEAASSYVRQIQPASGGAVRITLEESRFRTVQGQINDPSIQRLLLTAAQDSNDPGLRSESIIALMGNSGANAVRRAFMQVLAGDPNPGVRLKALEALKPFAADAEVRQSMANVLLHDDHTGLRTQAIDVLVNGGSKDMVEVLQELMRHEDNGYIRQRSRNALMAVNASVESF